jgi:transposase
VRRVHRHVGDVERGVGQLIDPLEFEIDAVGGPLRAALAGHAGYQTVQTIPGVGPVLAAVFVAEVGEVHRFTSPGIWPPGPG